MPGRCKTAVFPVFARLFDARPFFSGIPASARTRHPVSFRRPSGVGLAGNDKSLRDHPRRLSVRTRDYSSSSLLPHTFSSAMHQPRKVGL